MGCAKPILSDVGSPSSVYSSEGFLKSDTRDSLIEKYQTEGCLHSRDRVVEAYGPFISKSAWKKDPSGRHWEDLYQEGAIGLIKAMERYDPSRGVSFITYAQSWVSMQMFEYLIKGASLMKTLTTKSHRKVFFNIGYYRKGSFLSLDEKIAMSEDLSISIEDIELAEKSLNVRFDSIVESSDSESGEIISGEVLSGSFGSSEYSPQRFDEHQIHFFLTQAINKGLDSLPDRSRNIILSRYFSEEKAPTLSDLGSMYGVSCERIRQIESSSLSKLSSFISDDMKKMALNS